MKKLPTNKSVLKKIIDENCCYVDKTFFIRQMMDDGDGYWFLSRPRRFGKTLFLDTIRSAFSGNKRLFKGLYLENCWDWNDVYPIIDISFGRGTVSSAKMLDNAIYYTLTSNAGVHDIELTSETIPERFEELIHKLNIKFRKSVVVLVDEYDNPLLDNLTKKNAGEIQECLSSFYSVLKDTDRYLKFVFLTGVSKFSKTSIFSKLNNLTDISLHKRYADICGYTHKDLTVVFKDYLSGIDLQKVSAWYDGYNFLGNNLYNPYDILLFLKTGEFKSHWFETGTPSFLLDLMKKKKYFIPDLNQINLSDSQMGEFDINHIEIDTLLYQTGYLTIKNSYKIGDRKYYSLKIPNKEVSIGLNDYMLRMFFASGTSATATNKLSQTLFNSLHTCTPELLKDSLFAFFAGIPHSWYVKNNISEYEGYYCSVFYAFFAALGLTIIPEDITSRGRIDFTVIMEKAVYIFEIKMKSNPGNAMAQIKERKYYEKYLDEGKPVFLVGIEFDEKIKNLSCFETQKI